MGRIFGGFTYNEPQSLYPGAPIEEIKALAGTANKSYQENQDAFDSLDVAAQNLSVLDKDYAVKKAAIERVKAQLAEAAQGRMELAGSKARGAAKEFATNQLLRAAQEDYGSYGAYAKDINDRKDLSVQDKEAALRLTQDANQNALELDPSTGLIKNRFSGYKAPEKSVDIAKATRDFLEGAKDDGGMIKNPKTGEPMLRDIGGGQYIGVGKWEGISKGEASRMAIEYAMQSPEIQSYLQFQNDYNNLGRFGDRDLVSGKNVRRDLSIADFADLGYDMQDGKLGIKTKVKGKAKFEELPIYDEDGNMNKSKAMALYNDTWKKNRLARAVNPAADWLAHYKEDWHEIQNRDYIDAKDKEEKDAFTLTTRMIVPGSNSRFKAPEDFEAAYKASTDANTMELNRADKFIRDNNIPSVAHDLLAAAANGADISADQIQGVVGKDGKDYKGEIAKFLLAIKTNNKVAQESREYEKRMKKEAGLIDANGKVYNPSPKLISDAEKDAVDMFNDTMGKMHLKSSKDATSLAEAKKNAEAILEQFGPPVGWTKQQAVDRINKEFAFRKDNKGRYYELHDPKYAKYAQVLKDNADKNTQEIGLSTFGDDKFEQDLAAVVTTDLNANGLQGAKWLGGDKSGTELNSDDYEAIGNADPKSIRYTYKDGDIKLVFRPIQKNEGEESSKERNQMDYVEMNAPEGILPYLIKKNKTEFADVILSNKIDDIAASPNHSGIIAIPGYKPISVTVPFVSDQTSSPGGVQRYTAVIPTAESPNGKVYSFDNSGDLITVIKNYYK